MDKSAQEHKVSIASLAKDLFTYIDEARSMTDYERSLKGDYKDNPDLRYPQT